MASSSRLAPNEKGKIKVSVSTTGRKGRFSKNVRVYTNDPKKPMVLLTIMVESIPAKKYEKQKEKKKSSHNQKSLDLDKTQTEPSKTSETPQKVSPEPSKTSEEH